MRNLSLAGFNVFVLPGANISSTAIDLEENTLYIASEHSEQDDQIKIELWKSSASPDTKISSKGSSVFSTFVLSEAGLDLKAPQIISMRLLVVNGNRSLCLITRGGAILLLSTEDANAVADVEGSVESGILAAQWSPDDSLVVLVTGDEKLILMTADFDILSESKFQTSDFGEDVPINVGWGSKQTQFHGSLGKTAAQAAPPSTVGASPDDDMIPRISWRGDGGYFTVSAFSRGVGDDISRRIVRVYDRQAVLQSTCEPVPGLEHPLAWRPSGNLIASTQKYGFTGGGQGKRGRHDIVFFERNGLRHGEFGLRLNEAAVSYEQTSNPEGWTYKIKDLYWNSDSTVLAVWIRRTEGDVVQLWTTGNYHWYLKQEIHASNFAANDPAVFTSVGWHPEISLQMILTTSFKVIQNTYVWETCAASINLPKDTASVAVLDGSSILLTPFRFQNVPPPMSVYQISTSECYTSPSGAIPVHLTLSSTKDLLAALWSFGSLCVWDLQTFEQKRGQPIKPIRIWSNATDNTDSWISRQVVILAEDDSRTDELDVAVLGSRDEDDDVIIIYKFSAPPSDVSVDPVRVSLSGRNGRLISSGKFLAWQNLDGCIFEVDYENGRVEPIAEFDEFCFTSVAVYTGSPSNSRFSGRFIGLSDSAKLFICGEHLCDTISSNVTSFTVVSGFIAYTTTSHEAHFAPLSQVESSLSVSSLQSPSTHLNASDLGPSSSHAPARNWESRRVERGSRIVTGIPSTTSLVLQMPRGNLETIYPRPLVMELVKRDLNEGRYRKAFLSCRKHRIDFNLMVSHDIPKFVACIKAFVEQIDEVDHLNLFLTSLGRGNLPPETIAQLCDSIRVELEQMDVEKYVNCILTAFVVKSPPDHESALGLLLRLRATHPNLVEDAVKYIIFLVDADKLFDIALGMYDFSLVLMIAQHAQRDPREYLPFLRDLRTLPKYYQRFKIDDHLQRYEKALYNLSLAGLEYFDEALSYIERHQLYTDAMAIWIATDRYKVVLNYYGDWLFERREFEQAALVFVEASEQRKAMIAYERASQWQELFEVAAKIGLDEDETKDIAYRVAEELSAKKRFAEAARVLVDYAKDVREGVIELTHGNEFSEARRIIAIHSRQDLFTDIIQPVALESRAQHAEDIAEMRAQLQKQCTRLQELRIKKSEEPDAYYGVEDTNLHNVDVMTDVSIPATAFTRYTVAPSATSRTSKRSSRSKRKIERKIGSGRKGTVDEEEYLLKSVIKLVERFKTTQGEVSRLLPHLLQMSAEHRSEAVSLQEEVCGFDAELRKAVDEIWKEAQSKDGPQSDGWTARMREKEKEMLIDPLERINKPESVQLDWSLAFLQVNGHLAR